MDPMTALLEADRLYRFFHAGDDETLALQGVSLTLDGGEIVAVTGPSGSGKSTLLACLAGLDEPDGGTVRVCGERLSRREEELRARIRARSIGILYQQDNLIGHLSVADNVALAQQLAGGFTDAAWREALIDRVGLRERAHTVPAQLSGGEVARAGLAVALANDPAILLADEPTGELDEDTAGHVVELLHEQAGRGKAILVVTHSAAVAAGAARELRLRDGRLEP
jgi:putative ABC transport system ATP-binding protein